VNPETLTQQKKPTVSADDLFADIPVAGESSEASALFADIGVENASTSFSGDMGRMVGVGLNRTAGALGMALEQVGAEKAGQWVQEKTDARAEELMRQLSYEQQQAMQKKYTEKADGTKGFGEAWADPRTTLGHVAMSLPMMATGMTAGGVLTKLATFIPKISRTVAAAAGYGAGEGLIAGTLAGKEIVDEIRETPFEKLAQMEPFQQAYHSITDENMSHVDKLELAREKTASAAWAEVTGKVGAVTGILSSPTGIIFDRMARGIGFGAKSRPKLRDIPKYAGAEALQEMPQEGSEAYLGDSAAKKYIDPTINPTENVLEGAVTGGVAAGVTGGVMGVGAHGVGRRSFNQAQRQLNQLHDELFDEQGRIKDGADSGKVIEYLDLAEAARGQWGEDGVIKRPTGMANPVAEAPKGPLEKAVKSAEVVAGTPEDAPPVVDQYPEPAPERAAPLPQQADEVPYQQPLGQVFPGEQVPRPVEQPKAYVKKDPVSQSIENKLTSLATNVEESNDLSEVSGVGVEAREEVQEVRAPGSVETAVDAKAHEAATSPVNGLPEPTEAQKEAGNYKKGHVRIAGLDISIENPAGSVRRGVDEQGKAWETPIVHHYGYVKGTVGYDKDHLDVFLGPEAEGADTAYIVDQAKQDGGFDEHKIVIGARSTKHALDIYNSNYEAGWDGALAVTPMPLDAFRAWAASDAPKKGRFSQQKKVQQQEAAPVEPQSPVTDTFTRSGRDEDSAVDVTMSPTKDGFEITTSDPNQNPVRVSIGMGGVYLNDFVLNQEGDFVPSKQIEQSRAGTSAPENAPYKPAAKDRASFLELLANIEFARQTGDMETVDKLEAELIAIASGSQQLYDATAPPADLPGADTAPTAEEMIVKIGGMSEKSARNLISMLDKGTLSKEVPEFAGREKEVREAAKQRLLAFEGKKGNASSLSAAVDAMTKRADFDTDSVHGWRRVSDHAARQIGRIEQGQVDVDDINGEFGTLSGNLLSGFGMNNQAAMAEVEALTDLHATKTLQDMTDDTLLGFVQKINARGRERGDLELGRTSIGFRDGHGKDYVREEAYRRGLIDKSGAIVVQGAAPPADLPSDVVTTTSGQAFMTQARAQAVINKQGLADTHEVVAASDVVPGAKGFVGRRKAEPTAETINVKKSAAEAYLKELRRNGEMEVSFPESVAKQIKKHTGVDIEVDGEKIRIKQEVEVSDVVGRVTGKTLEEINKLGHNTTESDVILPQKNLEYIRQSHPELTGDDMRLLSDTINSPTDILPNISKENAEYRGKSVLFVRQNGKDYVTIVEVSTEGKDNIVWNFWKMNRDKSDRYLKKFKEEKARILQPGGRPDPHIPHDNVGKPEGLSGSQVEASSLKTTLPPVRGDVNSGIVVAYNEELNGIEITFPAKPDEDVRQGLKKHGFRWNRKKGIWYAKQNPSRLAFAEGLKGKPKAAAEIDTAETSSFGPVFREFYHDAKGAIKKLMSEKNGEAIAALYHADVGDIDLVWGKEGTKKSDGYGIAKIAKFHPEVLGSLQDVVSSMKVVSRSDTRVQLESGKHKAAVRLEWDGKAKQWLLTAFEKRDGIGATSDTSNINSVDDTARNATVPNTESLPATSEIVKSEKTDNYGAGNKLVTADRAEELRKKLREKLNQINSGIDPEMLVMGTELAVYHIEAGARSFARFAQAIMEDLGEKAKPFLKSWYMGAKNWPGMDKTGMDSEAAVDAANVDDIIKGTNTKEMADDNRVDQRSEDSAVRGVAGTAAASGETAHAGVASEAVRGTAEDGGTARSDADSGGEGTGRNQPPDVKGVPKARGGRNRTAGVHSAEAGTGSDRQDRSGRNLEPQEIPAVNYQIPADFSIQSGDVAKFNDNVAAIRILKTIQTEKRYATADEQALLSRYVGWGGLASAFRKPDGSIAKGWDARVAEVEALLSADELEAARNTTQFAHYTSKEVVDAVWQMVERLGFGGGLVLEPAMGTGNFIGMLPEGLRGNTRFTGVEYDSLTAGIAGALYPQAQVVKSGFEKVPIPPNYFDLVIGNPPFSQNSLNFKYLPKVNRHSMHNQFVMAGIEALKPGGVQVFVVSRYFMDAQNSAARAAIAEQADLVAAFRLPDTAFKQNAGTDVVTDIVVLQKRHDGVDPGDTAWTHAVPVADPLGGDPMMVNEYFAKNPNNIIGQLDRSGSMAHGRDVTVHLKDGQNLKDELTRRVNALPMGVVKIEAVQERTQQAFSDLQESIGLALRGAEVGSVVRNNRGELVQVYEREAEGGGDLLAQRSITAEAPWHNSLQQDEQGNWYEMVDKLDDKGKPVKVVSNGKVTNRNVKIKKAYAAGAVPISRQLGKVGFERLSDAVDLLAVLTEQISLETSGTATETAIEQNRKKLKSGYDAFVKRHGYMNAAKLSGIIDALPNGALLRSLEAKYEAPVTAAKAKQRGGEARGEQVVPADILTRRIIYPYEAPTRASSAQDALAMTLAESGLVNLERIAELTGTTPAEVIAELHDKREVPVIFKDPESGRWETANEYLGGNVVRKLEAAKAAGREKNIEALLKVQPEPWTADKVTVSLGATWIPTTVYADFVKHITSAPSKVSFSRLTNTFSVEGDSSKALQWNTPGRKAVDLVGNILNSQAIKVTSTIRDADGSTRTVVDQEATQAANDMAELLRDEFVDWAFRDGARRSNLVDLFNQKFNVRVLRQRDGSHLTFPGKVPDHIIKLRRHQINGIWRGIVDRFVLYDHAVGSGKTFTAIARAMERRRMGLSKKPMMVVPNHILEQVAKDVYALYPGAKILAAGAKDLSRQKRRRLFARIATGDWDLVIVPHSSFAFIGIDPETEMAYLREELRQAQQAVIEAQQEADENGDSGRFKPLTVKEAERLVDTIQGRLEKVQAKSRKKDMLLTFEQMGIDDLTVDESHEFKNLFYHSRLNVRGMNPKAGSGKAYDLWSKIRVLQDSKHGSVAFLTGTPVSNSAVELYGIMRYLAPDALQEMGLESFDAWRAQFATVSTAYEPTESGRGLKEVNRIGRDWSNMRSLMDLYYTFADAVSNEDIQQWYAEDNDGARFPLPLIKGGGRRSVNVEPTAAQEALIDQIVSGFDGLKGISDIQKRNAERLRLMDRARKVSLDVRAVDPSLTDKGGKLEAVAAEVKRIYDATTKDKGTQLVFLDRSVPKTKGDDKKIREYDALMKQLGEAEASGTEEEARRLYDKLEKYDESEMAELKAAQDGRWNAYDEIKNSLVAMGIPEMEIRYVQEASTDDQKAALFADVNAGRVRVLIGSTPRMGAGTNVQERLVGLHHVDVTWKPSDIEQREGRIVRQGNKLFAKYGDNFEVEILAYTTERTVDAKLWALNATKLKMINGLRKYSGDFTMEFDDSDSVGMAEIAAIASGEPLQLERVQLAAEIDKLNRQRRAHQRRMWGMEDDIARSHRAIERAKNIAELEKNAKALELVVAEASQRKVVLEAAGKSATFGFDAPAEAKQWITELAQQEQEDGRSFAVKVNGKKLTSKTAGIDAIQKALGDANEFEATFAGKSFIARGALDAALAETAQEVVKGHPAGEMDEVSLGAVAIGGVQFEVSLQLTEGKIAEAELFIERGSFRNVMYGDRNDMPGLVKGSAASMMRHVREVPGEIATIKAQADKARDDLPKLQELVNEPFAKEQELKDKQERLEVVEAELSREAQAAPETDHVPDTTHDEGADAPRFAVSDAEQSVPLADVEFDAVFERITARSKNRDGFIMVPTAEALPAAIKKEADKQGYDYNSIDGVFHKGKVYIVRDHIASAAHLEEVLFHEWHGHAGLMAMMGNDGAKLQVKLLELYDMMPHSHMLKISKKYGFNLSQDAIGLRRAEHPANVRHAMLMEEMLAHMTREFSQGKIATKVKEIIGMIRAWLRRNGFMTLADFTESDIALLLKKARAMAEAGTWAKDPGFINVQGQELLDVLAKNGVTEEMLRGMLAGVKFSVRDREGVSSGLVGVTRKEGVFTGEIKELLNAENAKPIDVAGGSADSLNTLAKKFGKRIVYFEALSEKSGGLQVPNGFVARTQPDVIFVNADANNHVLYILGHELQHTLRTENPGLWAEMVTTLAPLTRDWSGALNRLREAYTGTDDYFLMEEYFGNLVGEFFLDNKFWAEMGAADPSLFARVANAITALLDKAKSLLIAAPTATQHMSDIESARTIISDTMANYAKRRGDSSSRNNGGIIDSLGPDVRYSLRQQAKAPKKLFERLTMDIRGISWEVLAGLLPNRAKEVLGSVLSNPHWGSKDSKHRSGVYNENLKRDSNRSEMNHDIGASRPDGYRGKEGVDKDWRKMKKAQRKDVAKLLVIGDIDGVEYTSEQLRGKDNPLGKPADKLVVSAYMAFRETINYSVEVLFDKMGKLRLIPFEGEPYYDELIALLDDKTLTNDDVARRYGLNMKALDAYREVKAGEAFLNKITAPYKNETYYEPLREILIKGWNKNKVLAEHGVSAPYLVKAYDKIMEAAEIKIKTAANFKSQSYYKELIELINAGEDHPMFKKLELYQAYVGLVDFGSQLAKMKNEWHTRKGYLPRVRKEGEQHVRIMAADENGEYQVVWMQTTKTKGIQFDIHGKNVGYGAERLKAEIEKDIKSYIPHSYDPAIDAAGGYSVVIEPSKATSEEVFMGLGSHQAIETMLSKALDAAVDAGTIDDKLKVQRHILNVIADDISARGFGRHRISRSEHLIEGYEVNQVKDVLTQYIGGMTGWLSKAEFSLRATKLLAEIPPENQSDIRWATTYVRDALKNSTYLDQWSGTARSFATLWFLGIKTSTLALNATQNYTMGIPVLSKYTKGAARKMIKAQYDMMRSHYLRATGQESNLSEEEQWAIHQGLRRNRTQANYVRALSGLDDTGGLMGKGQAGLRWATEKSMIPFQAVESYFNREPALLAAFRVFRNEHGMSKEEALAKAEEFVNDTHFVVSKENIPEMLRKIGPAGKMIYTFQSFTHNYLLGMLFSLKKGEFGVVMRSLTALMLLGGMAALPFGSDLDKWYRKFFGERPLRMLDLWLRETAHEYTDFGDQIADFVMHGAPALAGVNFSGSLGVNIPWFSPEDDSMAERITGVWGGLFKKAEYATIAAGKGDVVRAAEYMTPEFMATMFRAVRMHQRGVTTFSGRPVFGSDGQPLRYTGQEAMWRFFGFMPYKPSRDTQARWDTRMAKEYWSDKKSDVLAQYRMEKDRRKAMQLVRDFNQELKKAPGRVLVSPIDGVTLRRALIARPNVREMMYQRGMY